MDKVEKLKELKSLLDGGFITQEEANKIKAEITGVQQTEQYKSVKIGNQVWMSENFDVDKFRNGDIIPQTQLAEEWKKAGDEGSPACCYYNNDPASRKIYGKLYNWFAISDPRGLVPTGWHVPTDAEWTTLTTYLGGEDSAGGKLKEAGTTHWAIPNTGATNETGFTGLPVGYSGFDGWLYYIGSFGFLWSSTKSSSTDAWTRIMGCYNANVDRRSYSLRCGFSVRCVRDA